MSPSQDAGSPKALISYRTFLGVIWGGTAITFISIVFRAYVRMKSFKTLLIDDFLVTITWALVLATAILWQCVAGLLFEVIAVSSGQKPPTLSTISQSETVLRSSLAVIILFYTGLWLIKFSFLAFFRRLGNHMKSARILWWVATGFTIATYIVCIGNIPYHCYVLPYQKLVQRCGIPSSRRYQQVILKVNCALDIFSDILIVSIPVTILWKSQITFKQKMALTGIFSLVILTIVIAIVRVAVVGGLTTNVEQSWLFLWTMIELCVAIIVGCLGSYRALFVINRNPVRYYHEGTRSSGKSRSKLSNPVRSKELYPIYSTMGGDSNEFVSPLDERNNHFAMNPLPQSEYRNYTEIRVAYPEPTLSSQPSFRR